MTSAQRFCLRCESGSHNVENCDRPAPAVFKAEQPEPVEPVQAAADEDKVWMEGRH